MKSHAINDSERGRWQFFYFELLEIWGFRVDNVELLKSNKVFVVNFKPTNIELLLPFFKNHAWLREKFDENIRKNNLFISLQYVITHVPDSSMYNFLNWIWLFFLKEYGQIDQELFINVLKLAFNLVLNPFWNAIPKLIYSWLIDSNLRSRYNFRLFHWLLTIPSLANLDLFFIQYFWVFSLIYFSFKQSSLVLKRFDILL